MTLKAAKISRVVALVAGMTSATSIASGQSCTWFDTGETTAARSGHSMVFDAARGVTVLFGGWNNGRIGSTSTWDGSSWTDLGVPGPSPRTRHVMAYDDNRNVTVLFGGETAASGSNDETWEWDGQTWEQFTNLGGPGGRKDAAMAFDSVANRVLMFGGVSAGTLMRDFWEWDGTAWHSISVPPGLSARRWPAMTFDKSRGIVVLFGGFLADQTYSGETWEYGPGGWALVATTGPSPREVGRAFVYDPVRQRSVFYGGLDGSGTLDDTWEWDGRTWTTQPASSADRRHNHALAYDSARGVTVLVGGITRLPVRRPDTWEMSSCTVCFADCTRSTGGNVLDIFDFLCFQDKFVRGDPYACNCEIVSGFGVCDIFDFLCFQNRFVVGCP